jgi:prepilin-type processing-associated H-X9-DG protein
VVRGPYQSEDACREIVLADSPSIFFQQDMHGLMDIAYSNAVVGYYGPGTVGKDKDIRHGTGSVCAFYDGHIVAYRPERLLAEVPLLEE